MSALTDLEQQSDLQASEIGRLVAEKLQPLKDMVGAVKAMAYVDPRPFWAKNNADVRWDLFFLKMAKTASEMSKDPSSQVGAVIARDQIPLSVGYNGFVRGMSDDAKRLEDRETKYTYTEHAEKNAIFNAARAGVDIRQSTIYSTHVVCCECAKAVCQSGITRVVYLTNEEFEERWADSITHSKAMFAEVGVTVVAYNETALL